MRVHTSRFWIVLLAFSLTSSLSQVQGFTVDCDIAGSANVRDEQHVVAGHLINSWQENLQGGVCRAWPGDATWIWLGFEQASGGFDTGISLDNVTAKKVSSIINNNIDQSVGAYYFDDSTVLQDANGDGKNDGNWWFGPKVVTSRSRTFSGGLFANGSHECYVVENHSFNSLGKLETYLDLDYKGNTGTLWNGGRYNLYSTTLENGIDQVWAVRTNAYEIGATPVALILEDWRNLGMINNNEYVFDWRVNAESAGKVNGELSFGGFYIESN